MNSTGQLLAAEDDPDDFFFLERTLTKAGLLAQTTMVRDGTQVIQYLRAAMRPENFWSHPLPRLILLDLAMPNATGFDVLHWMRNHLQLTKIPVAVFSGLEDPHQRNRALALGAKRYYIKSPDMGEWLDIVRQLATDFGLTPAPVSAVQKRQQYRLETCLQPA